MPCAIVIMRQKKILGILGIQATRHEIRFLKRELAHDLNKIGCLVTEDRFNYNLAIEGERALKAIRIALTILRSKIDLNILSEQSMSSFARFSPGPNGLIDNRLQGTRGDLINNNHQT